MTHKVIQSHSRWMISVGFISNLESVIMSHQFLCNSMGSVCITDAYSTQSLKSINIYTMDCLVILDHTYNTRRSHSFSPLSLTSHQNNLALVLLLTPQIFGMIFQMKFVVPLLLPFLGGSLRLAYSQKLTHHNLTVTPALPWVRLCLSNGLRFSRILLCFLAP